MNITIVKAAIFLLSTGLSASNTEKVCFNVKGMTCAACTITLKAAVKKLDGILSVSASSEEKEAVVEFTSGATSTKAILTKINDTGYRATVKTCKK